MEDIYMRLLQTALLCKDMGNNGSQPEKTESSRNRCLQKNFSNFLKRQSSKRRNLAEDI